ncbi:hypothetical protein WK09_28950 [Burkholderia ubonensis]|uniref:hypothetical protein n=1 Tax=Burkholderia ubonensis TaxID=101571 RepID=UPI0007570AB9|nr:hypothetical protein [Burkholderia ubonensis]KVR04715.1 hypothetical protein WK09_28950 [Burkholderia ubonensis]KVR43368.1 hypothetical protein WK18_18180 [Burkholderia ubonensis]KWB80181.1 hypothetical protein WL41_00650 [Burkholderia ubonensis]KWC04194.1 hypothetical protein WL43_19390 [Burkholderia ubonensis]
MANHPPYSVILSFTGDSFDVRAVEKEKIAATTADSLAIPILLDEFDHKLDDEFARRLGVAMLNLIALGQPDIKRFMAVTQDPESR